MSKVHVRRFAVLLMLVLLSLGTTAGLAAAQGGDLVLSTRYPGISARPGDNLSFSLDVTAIGAPAMAGIQVTRAPAGWETVLRGGGSVIHKVFAHPDTTAYLDLQVTVPKDANPGDYALAIQTDGPAGTRLLPLEVRVQPANVDKADLVAQYPSLEGPAGAQFEYRVTLKNTGGTKQLFSLAAQAPQGWEVAIHPAYEDKRIATIAVDAGGSQSLDVKVKVPQQAAAGEYQIGLQAAGDSVKAATDLTLAITGSHKLTIEPVSGRYNAQATAGGESVVELAIWNRGTAELKNVNFSNYAPTNWKVSFKPEVVASLPPGESRQIQAVVKPADKAIAGDYVVSLMANTPEATDSAEFRVAVQTPTLWGWVGVALIIIVVAGVGATFRYYGRR